MDGKASYKFGGGIVSPEPYKPFESPQGTTDAMEVMRAHTAYLEARIAELYERVTYLENRPRFL